MEHPDQLGPGIRRFSAPPLANGALGRHRGRRARLRGHLDPAQALHLRRQRRSFHRGERQSRAGALGGQPGDLKSQAIPNHREFEGRRGTRTRDRQGGRLAGARDIQGLRIIPVGYRDHQHQGLLGFPATSTGARRRLVPSPRPRGLQRREPADAGFAVDPGQHRITIAEPGHGYRQRATGRGRIGDQNPTAGSGEPAGCSQLT